MRASPPHQSIGSWCIRRRDRPPRVQASAPSNQRSCRPLPSLPCRRVHMIPCAWFQPAVNDTQNHGYLLSGSITIETSRSAGHNELTYRVAICSNASTIESQTSDTAGRVERTLSLMGRSPLVEQTCPVCCQQFQPRRGNQRICSRACAQTFHVEPLIGAHDSCAKPRHFGIVGIFRHVDTTGRDSARLTAAPQGGACCRA